MIYSKKLTPAMHRIGTLCGCAALTYLLSRMLFSSLAGFLLSLRVPGATLSNPAGFTAVESALVRLFINFLSLLVPFVFLRFLSLRIPLRIQCRRWNILPRLFLLFMVCMLCGNVLSALFAHLEPGTVTSRIHLPASGTALLIAYLAVCVLPALGEELLFRGMIQGVLSPFDPLAAIIGQTVLFSLLHGKLSSCIAALFGGFALGVCAYATRSLLPGILFHLYNNTTAFISQYAIQFWDPGLVSLLNLLLFLLPVLFILFPALHCKARLLPRVQQRKDFMFWLFRCPGWLICASILLIFCIKQTYF